MKQKFKYNARYLQVVSIRKENKKMYLQLIRIRQQNNTYNVLTACEHEVAIQYNTLNLQLLSMK